MEIERRVRWYQQPFHEYLVNTPGARAIEIAHRRWGKDEIVLSATCELAHKRVGSYWHCLPEYAQARKAIWTAVNPHTGKRRIDEAFPPEIRENTNEQEMFIRLKCGSTWQLIGSDRYDATVGAGPAGIAYSEWALGNPSAWAYHRPMLEENGGWAAFITTPRGRNHAYAMYQMAKDNPRWFAEVSSIHQTGALSPAQLEESLTEYVALYGEDIGRAQFEQEYECFKPEALVMCHDRARPIADIREGDSVLTHTGRFRRVDGVMSRPYAGEMIRISAYGSRDIVCTPEHPVRLCDPSTQSYSWKAAKDVAAGDWLVTPRMATGAPVISQSLAKIIAWYVCEGNVSGHNLTFSIGWHEPDYVADLVSALAESGFEARVTKCGNVASVSVNSVQLSDFLVSECGSLSRNKRLPLGLIRGNEAVVWGTLFKGDGCIHRPKGSGRWRDRYLYTTVSEGLAQQVQIIGASLGYTGSYSERKNSGVFPHRERISTCQTVYTVQMTKHSGLDARNGKTRMAKNGALGRVRAVSSEEYVGTVHNLSVAGDESYVVNARAIHNCSFNAAILGAFYAREMVAVRKEGRITEIEAAPGLPVHRAWDIGVRDDTSIWWFQVVGSQIFILDCYSQSGMGVDHYADIVHKRHEEHGWEMGEDFVPHDAKVREWGSGRTRVETMQSYGLKPRLVSLATKLDGINAARQTLARCVFHPRTEEQGISALEQYRREWDDDKKTFKASEVHDWSSHLSDAFRYMSLAWREAPREPPPPVKPIYQIEDGYALAPPLPNVRRR